MQFLSFSFLALFTLCFFLYYAVKGRARNLILLVTSCIFIGWYYLPFLLTAVVVAPVSYTHLDVYKRQGIPPHSGDADAYARIVQ